MKNKLVSRNVYTEIRTDGVYRIENSKIFFGASLPVIIHNGQYYLTDIKIYADGLIDCWGLITIDEFKQKLDEGWVITEIPNNTEVSIFSLGSFTASSVINYVKPNELIKEIDDIIKELNDLPTTSKICQRAFEEYQKDPTDSNKEELRTAYEAIPEHNRIYVLGDMQNKDFPIRHIIYNE